MFIRVKPKSPFLRFKISFSSLIASEITSPATLSGCRRSMEEKEENHITTEVENEDSDPETRHADECLNSMEMKLKKKKLLLDFRCKVEDAILSNYIIGKPDENLSEEEIAREIDQLREISLWGIPLLPSKGDEGTDILLLKFLKSKDFKVKEAFEMLQKTLKWRIDNRIDGICEEKLGLGFGFENGGLVDCTDKEGRPLCFCTFGNFMGKEKVKKFFDTKAKREEFVRWRIQCVEMEIKKLDFRNGGVNSIVQITDLSNQPGPGMKELRSVCKKTLLIFQENYPEIIYKNIIINVPFWFYAMQALHSPVVTQRTKSKFVLARPAKVTETLLKFVAPEHLPVEYGGLKRDNDEDFSPADKSCGLIVKANSAGFIHIPVSEGGVTLLWDITVIGWEISYKEEFIPDDEGSYKVLLQREKRNGDSVRNSFYINEPGQIVITIDNSTTKKKSVFYRTKCKPTLLPVYILLKK